MHFHPDKLIENYVYPLFYVNNYEDLITRMTWGTVIFAIGVLINSRPAGYGRYSTQNSGLPPTIAWIIQESPSFFVPMSLIIYGNGKAYNSSITNQISIGMFVMHYFQRAFIFPIVAKFEKKTPWHTFILAFLTCLYNGVLHGLYFVNYKHYDDEEYFLAPNFWIGIVLFLYGMKVNIGCDSTLRNLRTNDGSGYKIPKGGLFEYVSCANYFGEILEMWGYALTTLAPPAIAHAFFTTCFLSRRACHHHQWYLKKFEDYPSSRKAVIPYIL